MSSVANAVHDRPGGLSYCSGVTLIEMLVVMAIIGLMAAILFPSVSSGIDSIRMNSASQSVATFLNAAVTRVERRGEPVELVIDPASNSFRYFSNEPNSNRELNLPEGVTIAAVLPQIEAERGSPRRLILLPGAAAPGVGIELANRRGSHRVVRLDPMTGFPRIESVQSK